MNRKILAFLTGLLTVLGIAAVVYGVVLEKAPYERVSPDDIWFTLSHNGMEDHIRAWKARDNVYYVFLPSYVGRGELHFDAENTRRLTVNGKVISPQTDMSNIHYNKQYGLGIDGKKTKIEFRKSQDVATMFLSAETDEYLDVEDRNKEEDVVVSLIDKDGRRDLPGMTGKLRGRGNSTWLVEKKPYRLELAEETPLLEMGKAKRWQLLANAYDATNVKNKLIFDLAQTLFEDWSPDGKFVDVYFNGEYRGLYLLAEKIEVDNSRVAKDVKCLLTQETIGRARSIGQSYAVTKWLEATGKTTLSREDADFLGVVNLNADDEEMTADTEGVPEPVEALDEMGSELTGEPERTGASEQDALDEDGTAALNGSARSVTLTRENADGIEDGAQMAAESELQQMTGTQPEVTETSALRQPYTGDIPLKEIAGKMPHGTITMTKTGPMINLDIVRNPRLARETNRYITHRRLGIEIVYPSRLNDAEYKEITAQVQNMENKLFVGGKGWSKVINRESWAKRYLLDEFSGNFDADKLSSYFYLKEKHGKQKFVAGPVWDYDKAFMQEEADGGPYLFSAAADWRRRNVWTPYYKRLLGREEFRECVADIYKKELRPQLIALRDQRLEKLRYRIHAAAKNNELRWGIFTPPVGYTNQNGEAAMDALAQFLSAKIAQMDDEWITGHEYVTVGIEAQRGGKMLEYKVRKGDLFTQFPDAQYYGITNPAWYEMVTKKKYTQPFAAEEDIVLWLGRQEPLAAQ